MSVDSPLSMRTAKCEGCGCTWEWPCMINAASHEPLPPAEVAAIMKGKNPEVVISGCSWDMAFWRAGRAVCSVCVTSGKVPA